MTSVFRFAKISYIVLFASYKLAKFERNLTVTMDVDEEIENTILLKSISPEDAGIIAREAIAVAHELGLTKGKVAVCGREAFQLASASMGAVTRANDMIVAAKLATVMNTGRSTHEQHLHMKFEKIDPADYAGAILTKFGGGLTVFSDADCTVWVGAIAFSGGSEIEDMTCCRHAIAAVGLFCKNTGTNQ